MQDLDMEILRIGRFLPNTETTTIKNFMISIPEAIEYLRVPLTLVHFYNIEDDKNTLKLENENIEYANLIHDLFPMYSVNKIVKKLRKYGNITERYKLVIRNILKYREQELKNAIDQVSDSVFNIRFKPQKRSDNQHDNYEVNCKSDDGFRSSDEYQRRVCDNDEPTSLLNKQRESKDISATVVVTPSCSSQAPLCSENFHLIGNSGNHQWNQEASDENTHFVNSRGQQQPEATFYCDLLPTSSDVPYANTESVLSLVTKQLDSNFERNDTESITSEENFSHLSSSRLESTSNHSSEGVDLSPQQPFQTCIKKSNLYGIRNIATKLEEPFEISKNKHNRPPETSKKNHLEPLYSNPSRKKLKTSHFTQKENAVVIDNVNMDNGEVILLNSPNQEESDVEDNYEKLFQPHMSLSNAKPKEMKKNTCVHKLNYKLISNVMEIFSDADPDYIKQLYGELSDEASTEEGLYNSIIEKILSNENYPKRATVEASPEVNFDLESQLQTILELLPDADPSYLRMKVTELNPEEITSFIDEALERKNYPTLKEYLRKQKLSAQKRQYTDDFSVENYVNLVPNPKETFLDPNRKINMVQEDKNYVLQFFKNKFNRTNVRNIHTIWSDSDFRPYACYKSLAAVKGTMKTYRGKVNMSSLTCSNIPLLQELAFIEHENEILSYIKDLERRKEEERKRIKQEGLMLTCSCCFDDEILPGDTQRCTNNCVFCKQCIIKSVEVAFGEGKLVFPCLGDCGSNFSLQNLQDVLPPNLFSKVAQKHAVAEVKAAGIEDLEFCPFCDFATIPPGPPETNKIFVCMNPECLKESCRLCKEPSHVPLRCDEVEKDEEVKKRVYIENKMTEALLRKCSKCGVSFYKEEGCNKMTCSCGTSMCYICGNTVTDYKHFNGLGGENFDLCPLYSDTNEINQQNVLKGAEAAKEELGVAGSSDLKNDPTKDVRKYFQDRAKMLPVEPHMEHLQILNVMAQAIAIRDPDVRPIPLPVRAARRNSREGMRGPQQEHNNHDRETIQAARRPPQLPVRQPHRFNRFCPCFHCARRAP